MKTIIEILIGCGVVFLGIGVGTGIILIFLDLIDFLILKTQNKSNI